LLVYLGTVIYENVERKIPRGKEEKLDADRARRQTHESDDRGPGRRKKKLYPKKKRAHHVKRKGPEPKGKEKSVEGLQKRKGKGVEL